MKRLVTAHKSMCFHQFCLFEKVFETQLCFASFHLGLRVIRSLNPKSQQPHHPLLEEKNCPAQHPDEIKDHLKPPFITIWKSPAPSTSSSRPAMILIYYFLSDRGGPQLVGGARYSLGIWPSDWSDNLTIINIFDAGSIWPISGVFSFLFVGVLWELWGVFWVYLDHFLTYWGHRWLWKELLKMVGNDFSSIRHCYHSFGIQIHIESGTDWVTPQM